MIREEAVVWGTLAGALAAVLAPGHDGRDVGEGQAVSPSPDAAQGQRDDEGVCRGGLTIFRQFPHAGQAAANALYLPGPELGTQAKGRTREVTP